MGSYDPGQPKFHRGTFYQDQTPPAIWLMVGGAGMVVGEASFQSSPLWLAVGATVSAAVAIAAWRSKSRSGGALALGLGLLAVVMFGTALRAVRVRSAPELVANAAVEAAIKERGRLLGSAVAGSRQVGLNALQRTAGATPGATPGLGDLLGSSRLEQSLVVLGGDTLIAVAGTQRSVPLDHAVAATLVRVPFAHLLVITVAGPGARKAEVSLLLDASSALPQTGNSLAQATAGWRKVGWRWRDLPPRTDFTSIDEALAAVPSFMEPIPPSAQSLMDGEAALARWSAVLALVLVAVVVLLAGAPPVARMVALVMPVWVLFRAGVIGGGLGPIALPILLTAASLLMIAVVLWHRPPRRTNSGLAASIILLALAPPLVALAGWKVAVAVSDSGMLTWFAWQGVLALATAAYLALASAPLKSQRDDLVGWRTGVLAVGLTIIAGLIGIEAWQPGLVAAEIPTGWNSTWFWYLPVWLIALGAQLTVIAPRLRRLAVVFSAAILAALSAWGASLDSRLQLADTDINRLAAATDVGTLDALESFGDEIALGKVENLDSLYLLWRKSDLAALDVPIQLAIWSDTTVAAWVALDALAPSWGDLQAVVAPRPLTRRTAMVASTGGQHQVMVVPVGGDTAVSVLVGPRSRLVAPTRFGRMVGWRSEYEPPFRVASVAGMGVVPDGVFHRTGRTIRIDRLIDSGNQPMVVRATVEISPPPAFAVRAALTVLLDVLLLLLVWWLVERVLGFASITERGMFRRSYRRTIAAALISFFVVPAALFTFWSVLRLQEDVVRRRGTDVADALQSIEAQPELTERFLRRPEQQSLALVADRVNAEVAVYHDGRLVSSSAPLLASLGVIAPVADPALVVAGSEMTQAGNAGNSVRFGVVATSVASAQIATAIPGADAQRTREQIDLALLLLLASLGGTLAAIAVAGAVARALGQPIEALRKRAIAIGRRETVPPMHHTVAEFEPVFGAITQMERDLRQSESRLEEETARTARVVAWGEMARQVAHEIKNPLTPMRLGLQHLRRLAADQRPDLPEQMSSTADKLLTEIDRLDKIARSFARYGSPPEQEQGPLEPVDLADACRELAELFLVAGTAPQVEVVVTGLVPAVMGRREELIQVLLNLLDNARQAGAGLVTMAVSKDQVVVSDDGHGIPGDQLEAIFEPTFSTTTSGTGLGLAIVRRLVESWGGQIKAESELEKGSTLIITFPASDST